MRLRDLADDREPQAGAGHRTRCRGSIETVEDVLAILFRDPGAVVPNAKLTLRERHVDARAGARPLARVLQQVPHPTPQPPRDPPPTLEPLGNPLDRRLFEVGVPMHAREAGSGALDGRLDELVELHFFA